MAIGLNKRRQGLEEPLFNIASYARRGPGRRDRLSSREIHQIRRTIARAPEVMVKVLSRGGQDLGAVRRHLNYLRKRKEGELEIETDDGEKLEGSRAARDLLDDWNLDLQNVERRSDLDGRGRKSTKLVHKVLFSMPPGTPADKVLRAAKNFAREEFALQHRYAMVLHTDEPHPHVHMVVKAVSEQGVRLHIRKETLRGWRREFARHLRALGIEANATERAVRGQSRGPKLDGIYRARRRGNSTHIRARVQGVAKELAAGALKHEPGKRTLEETRRDVERGWRAVTDILVQEGQPELAAQVRQYGEAMGPVRTEKEQIAAELLQRTREPRVR